MTPDPVTAATRLAELLVSENAALEALDIQGAMALLGEKQRALEIWAALPSDCLLSARPDDLDQALQRLRALADENRALLRHALAVQMRVIGVLAETMPRTRSDGSYGPSTRCVRPSAWVLAARA